MIGRTLSHYEIVSKLGEGGMGEVYRARDTRLRRDVAVKVLRPEFAEDPERLDRFRREAQALAALDHPTIATVFSVEEADGARFLTMQLVEGTTLDQLIGPDGLSLERFFEIAVPLTDGIAAAHERGVVHRDLKPSNVMWSEDGRVKILDFGLAKLAAASSAIDGDGPTDLLTRDGAILGTLPYMSPEQISGQPVDARTDVFSLGIVLYEMATGRRPFVGANPAALLSAILSSSPPGLHEVQSQLPARLGRIVERCLAREPARRTQTVREVHGELRELSEETRSSPARPSHPAGSRGPGRGPSVAVLPFVSLSSDPDDEYFADGIADEVINALGRLPDLRVAARTSAFSFKGTTEDLRIVGEKLGVGAVLEGSVRRAGARLRVAAQLVDVASGFHLWSERYDRKMDDVFEIQDEIAGNLASRLKAALIGGPEDPTITRGTNDVEAFELCAKGRSLLVQRTPDEMRRAATCFQRAVERDPDYALAWAGLSNASLMLVDYGHGEPEMLSARAEEAARRALELAPALPEAHVVSGLLAYSHRDATPAIEGLERAVELRPSYAEAHELLSWLRLLLGQPIRALASARRAVELDPLAPEALNHVGLGLLATGDARGALRELRRSRDVQPDFTTSAFYEAVARLHVGDFAESAAILGGLSVPWAGSGPQTSLAMALAARGKKDEALAVVARLNRTEEHDQAGLIHAALGDLDRAYESFGRVGVWGYWPMLVIHNFFPDILASLRVDSRYPELVVSLDRAWGFDRGGEPGTAN